MCVKFITVKQTPQHSWPKPESEVVKNVEKI